MNGWLIQTERLGLRPFQPEDAAGFYALNADPEVIRYTGDPPFESVEATRRFIIQYNTHEQTGMARWAVLDKATGTFLGFCGLKLHPDAEVDLGYRFQRKHWGKGYATEACRGCIVYAFNTLKLNSLIGRVAKENHASIRVLEKCGFHREADAPCDALPGWRYRLANVMIS